MNGDLNLTGLGTGRGDHDLNVPLGAGLLKRRSPLLERLDEQQTRVGECAVEVGGAGRDTDVNHRCRVEAEPPIVRKHSGQRPPHALLRPV